MPEVEHAVSLEDHAAALPKIESDPALQPGADENLTRIYQEQQRQEHERRQAAARKAAKTRKRKQEAK